jgi:DNA replicative helicase MCM subunit Mcm2 (Cdc46/Mcm family)
MSPFFLAMQARQLESLARLSEARARVELRQVVTRADAEVCVRQSVEEVD